MHSFVPFEQPKNQLKTARSHWSTQNSTNWALPRRLVTGSRQLSSMNTQYAGSLISGVIQSDKAMPGPSQVGDFWAGLVNGSLHVPPEQRDDAATLLRILSLMNSKGTSVTMLEEGCRSQERWDNTGELAMVDPVLLSLDQALISMVLNKHRFKIVVEHLCAASLLKTEDDQLFLPLEIRSRILHAMDCDTIDFWFDQAILLVSNATPRENIPKPEYLSFLLNLMRNFLIA